MNAQRGNQLIRTARDGRVAVLTFNRPRVLNAWNREMRREIMTTLADFNSDPGTSAVVMTGAGDKAFSTGQDLGEPLSFGRGDNLDWVEDFRAFFTSIRAMSKPLVAAINGLAVGSGLEVALFCDLRIGHPGTRLGNPDINVGLPSGMGPWILRDAIGMPRAVELLLTGRLVEGEEAMRWGLLNELTPLEALVPRAIQLASELGSKPPTAMRLHKQRWRELTEPGFQEALDAARRYQKEAFETGEPQAMMANFLSNRGSRRRE